MIEFGLLRKSSKFPAMICLARFGGLEMKRGIDAEEIHGGVFETGARAERAAQDRRSRRPHWKSAADAHDLTRVRDPIEITAVRSRPELAEILSAARAIRCRAVESANGERARRCSPGWNR